MELLLANVLLRWKHGTLGLNATLLGYLWNTLVLFVLCMCHDITLLWQWKWHTLEFRLIDYIWLLWTFCQLRKIAGCTCAGRGNVFSTTTVLQSRHASRHVTYVPWCMPGSLTGGFIWSRWRGKRSRYSRRMRNPSFYVFCKRPITTTKLSSHHDENIVASGCLVHRNDVSIICHVWLMSWHRL